MKNKLISPSAIIGFLFPEKYNEIPKWILEEAAEFGSELHKMFELYLNDPTLLDTLRETISENELNKLSIFNNFVYFVKDYKIKSVKLEKEFKNQTLGLHGFIDCLTPKTIYDWKIRADINSKDNFLCEKIQMITYDLILNRKYDWKIVIFQKKPSTQNFSTFKVINKQDIPIDEYETIVNLILKTTQILQERERILWKYQPKQKKLNLKK